MDHSGPFNREREAPHKRVHDCAIAALQAHESNNQPRVEQQVTNMENASLEVLVAFGTRGSLRQKNAELLCEYH